MRRGTASFAEALCLGIASIAYICNTADMSDEFEVFDAVRSAAGKLLKERRLELKLTQAEVGERVGVEQSTVSEWERAKAWPKDLRAVCERLGIPRERMLAALKAASQVEDDVERAIKAQVALSSDVRDALLTIYRKLRAADLGL